MILNLITIDISLLLGNRIKHAWNAYFLTALTFLLFTIHMSSESVSEFNYI